MVKEPVFGFGNTSTAAAFLPFSPIPKQVEILTSTVDEETHPFKSVPVNVYVVFTFGFTGMTEPERPVFRV